MNHKEMSLFMTLLKRLSPDQRRRARSELDSADQSLSALSVIDQRLTGVTICPVCGSGHRIGHGSANGLPRYKCKDCGRTYNPLSGSNLARLRMKGKWLPNAQALIDGLSLDKVADYLNIAHSTAFRWRHRFMAEIKTIQAQALGGIVEADQTYMLESGKGKKMVDRKPRKRGGKAKKRGLSKEQVPILVVRDRSGATLSTRLEADNAETIAKVMEGRLASDVILCTDGSKTLAAVAKNLKVVHRPVNLAAGVRVIERVIHVQNVNAFDARLKGWMDRFHGVATKYLENYLGWFRLIDSTSLNPSSLLALSLRAS